MKKRYTNAELARLVDTRNWAALWPIVESMVKHEVKRCMQDGLDPFYVRDDLMQEAYLAAWQALPTWNAFESGLRKWVGVQVRGAVLKANSRAASGMIGGRDSGLDVVSMHAETVDGDGGDDEQGSLSGPEASMVYENPPEGFEDPAEQPEYEELLELVPAKDRDMVRRLCGLGVPAETQEEYARAEGLARDAIAKRVQRLKNKIVTKSSKTGKYAIRIPDGDDGG